MISPVAHPAPEPAAHGTGYRLVQVYTVEQQYRLRSNEQHTSEPGSSRPFQMGWDWRITGRLSFEVAVTLTALPTNEQRDESKVVMAAAFEATGNAPTVPFSEFVRFNATALLLPFAREALAQITARGPFGPFWLEPFNVVAVMNNFDPARALGMKQVRDDPALRREFGLVDEPALKP